MTAFIYDDDPCRSSGEGITRTANPRATLWPFETRFDRGMPMRGTIRAIDRQQANEFAKARHPNATQIRVFTKKEKPEWL